MLACFIVSCVIFIPLCVAIIFTHKDEFFRDDFFRDDFFKDKK